jgi:hypothetical protein
MRNKKNMQFAKLVWDLDAERVEALKMAGTTVFERKTIHSLKPLQNQQIADVNVNDIANIADDNDRNNITSKANQIAKTVNNESQDVSVVVPRSFTEYPNYMATPPSQEPQNTDQMLSLSQSLSKNWFGLHAIVIKRPVYADKPSANVSKSCKDRNTRFDVIQTNTN